MIKIATLKFNPFQENTYIIYDETNECLVVDAGNYSAAEDNALLNFIREKGLKPVMAVNTHGHIDHILGVQYVKETFNVPFALHSGDNFLIESAQTHAEIYGFKIGEIPVVDKDLKDADEIVFGNSRLTVIHTPGHTPGHVCLFDQESKLLLTGDTLFKESIGRTDLPGGDYTWIMRSILEKIVPLGGDVTFFPGHGADSTISHELLYNPFIVEVLNNEINYK